MRRSIPLGLAAAASLVAAPGAYATFPGDAGLLVFQQATDDGIQLFTMPANGGEPLQITHVAPREGDDVGASAPDWSPDGTRIVARVRSEVGAVAALHQVDIVAGLPKTRSGKILRKTMREIADGKTPTMPATIEDPKVLDEIGTALQGRV